MRIVFKLRNEVACVFFFLNMRFTMGAYRTRNDIGYCKRVHTRMWAACAVNHTILLSLILILNSP
jgi:hypothetical protein